jgi:hypothetical protein
VLGQLDEPLFNFGLVDDHHLLSTNDANALPKCFSRRPSGITVLIASGPRTSV